LARYQPERDHPGRDRQRDVGAAARQLRQRDVADRVQAAVGEVGQRRGTGVGDGHRYVHRLPGRELLLLVPGQVGLDLHRVEGDGRGELLLEFQPADRVGDVQREDPPARLRVPPVHLERVDGARVRGVVRLVRVELPGRRGEQAEDEHLRVLELDPDGEVLPAGRYVEVVDVGLRRGRTAAVPA